MDRDLDALLNTRPTADGRDDEFERLWAHYLAERPKPTYPLGPIVAKEAPPSMAPTPARTTAYRRVPKVGTHIQRSTAANDKKIRALLETPPPPPRRVHKVSRSHPAATRRMMNKETDERKTLTELFGGTLSDLSEDEHSPDTATKTPMTSAKETASEQHEGTTNTAPPPVIINVSGIDKPVPYYAVHTARRYKARVGDRRFALRFNRSGKLRSHREL